MIGYIKETIWKNIVDFDIIQLIIRSYPIKCKVICLMNNNINWENIIDGFQGFEKLAVQFLNDVYVNINWTQTSSTRDGNKDGVAVIMGYQSYKNTPTYWWMEAKYSQSFERLSRYRIDATVVSAILEGNVDKVVFVTNIIIDTKTMSDITEALKYTACCTEVEFYTKYSLEYWLLQSPEIYKSFFSACRENIPTLVDDYIVSQEIVYYRPLAQYLAFIEPVRELVVGEQYVAYFGVVSRKSMQISIQTAGNLKGIRFLSKVKNIPIHEGENTLNFAFMIKENYGYKRSSGKRIPMPEFKIGNTSIYSYRHIPVIRRKNSVLDLPSQKNILEILKKKYTLYIHQHLPIIVSINGESAMGKSMLLEKFLGEYRQTYQKAFYCEFTETGKGNAKLLINLLIYILFPYLAPDTIDLDYIKSIDNSDIQRLMSDLIKYKDDNENILSCISCLVNTPELLPNKISINDRMIILDNMHLLEYKSSLLVSKIIVEVYEKGLPVFLVLCGQPPYFNRTPYQYLIERCVVTQLKLDIDSRDILDCCQISLDGKYDLSLLDSYEMNAANLLLFYEYITAENKTINTFQELLVALRFFWISDFSEQYIHNKFKNSILQDEYFRNILDRVYWSCSPVNIHELFCSPAQIENLIVNNLLKYNSNGELVPTNILYRSCYRKHYLPNFQNFNYIPNSPEDIRIKLLTSLEKKEIQESIGKVSKLFYCKQYYNVIFILESTFLGDRRKVLKNLLKKEEYYSLYYFYVYSKHQNGEPYEYKKAFTTIKEAGQNSYNLELLHLSLQCLWELGVIDYDNMEYNQVLQKKSEADTIILKINRLLKNDNNVKNYVNYHDFLVLDTLIKREIGESIDDTLFYERTNDMYTYGFSYRALSFSARYALVLCSDNIELCTKMLYETGQKILQQYGKEDKHYLWCMFFYNFYMLVWKNEISYFEPMVNFHEQMKKNQYGNYRKKLYAIAAYLYSIGDIANGNRYLFRDTIFPYEARNRNRAFYYETLALYEALNGNFEIALNLLDKASDIFKDYKKYKTLLNHNKKILEERKFSSSRIRFLFNYEMDNNTYYIDPNSIW